MYHIELLAAPTPRQLREIIELYRTERWWWQDKEHDDIAEKIVSGSFRFMVAVSNDSIIGMGRAISDGVSDAYIQDVTVKKTMRGTGIGSALLKALVRQLKEAGINWIGLIAEGGSHPFYEKHGFSPMFHAMPMLLLDKD